MRKIIVLTGILTLVFAICASAQIVEKTKITVKKGASATKSG